MSEVSNFARQKFERLELIAADRELPPSAACVAIMLLRFMGPKHRVAYPSVATLAGALGMSRRGVQIALSALVQRGHLLRKTGGGWQERGAGKTTSRYMLPTGADTTHTRAPIDELSETERAHKPAREGRTNLHEKGARPCTRTLSCESRHAGSLPAHQRGGFAANAPEEDLKKGAQEIPPPLREDAERRGLSEREALMAWECAHAAGVQYQTLQFIPAWVDACKRVASQRSGEGDVPIRHGARIARFPGQGSSVRASACNPSAPASAAGFHLFPNDPYDI